MVVIPEFSIYINIFFLVHCDRVWETGKLFGSGDIFV